MHGPGGIRCSEPPAHIRQQTRRHYLYSLLGTFLTSHEPHKLHHPARNPDLATPFVPVEWRYRLSASRP